MSKNQDELIKDIVKYLVKNIFDKHIASIDKRHTTLNSYKYNPIVVRYLSQLIEGRYSPMGVAKALFYPRILGTSINTSFGTWIQNVIVDLKVGDASGSIIKGIDIEFEDKIDGRYKYCQLKSGPSTINYGDVSPMMEVFNSIIRLGKTNRKDVRNTDFIIGVVYGDTIDLSQHYLNINKTFPVYAGKEFWEHLTGDPSFYSELIKRLTHCIDSLQSNDIVREGCRKLAQEISESDSFHFRE